MTSRLFADRYGGRKVFSGSLLAGKKQQTLSFSSQKLRKSNLTHHQKPWKFDFSGV
jgi:hypothetical protein